MRAILGHYSQEVRGFETNSIRTVSSFRSAHRSVETLLRQLWTIPSALSDVLIAIAMIILVSVFTVLPFV